MKHFYLTFSAICLTIIAFSQPIILGSDINTVAGETFTAYYTNWVSEGAAGSNVTWDLSNMVSSTSVAVSSETANSSFPSSNTSMNYGGQYSYELDNSTAQVVYGQLAGTTLISFSNPMQMLAFPINTTLNSDDTFTATFTSGGFPFSRNGTTNVMCDSWGTVITPSGTFTNVLRVKVMQDYIDTYAGGTIDYNVVAYVWYKAGFHQPIASVTTSINDFGTSSYGFYLDAASLGMDEMSENIFSVSPCPAINELHITKEGNKEVKAIEIIGLDGSVKQEFTGMNSDFNTLNIENINSGMYILKITLFDDETKLVKFVKQ